MDCYLLCVAHAAKKRLKLAAYFTPPQLAKYAIEKLRELGIHPGTSRILDPSSGGAAFLVPLAQVIALDAKEAAGSSCDVGQDIRDYNEDDCRSTEELTRWLRKIAEENNIHAPLSIAAAAADAERAQPASKELPPEVVVRLDTIAKLRARGDDVLHFTG